MAKDKQEYDYEGDMAMSQLKSIIANAQRLHDMMKPNDNLPEWVQSKITLAEDYISTVANYCESLDEEMKPYVKAAQQKFDAQAKAQKMGKKQAGTMSAAKERKDMKQSAAAQKAIDIVKGKKNVINKEPKVEVDAKV